MDNDPGLITKLLDWILTGLISIMAYFLKDQHDRIRGIEDKHNNLHLEVAKNYIAKDDFSEFKKELKTELSEIKELIKDGKST